MPLADRQYEAIIEAMREHYLHNRSGECSCGAYIAPDHPDHYRDEAQPERFLQHLAQAIRIAVDAASGPPVNKDHSPSYRPPALDRRRTVDLFGDDPADAPAIINVHLPDL